MATARPPGGVDGSEYYKAVLEHCKDYLIDTLNIESSVLLSKLQDNNVITFMEKEHIEETLDEPTQEDNPEDPRPHNRDLHEPACSSCYINCFTGIRHRWKGYAPTEGLPSHAPQKRKASNNGSQVARLVEVLMKKTEQHYEVFCQSLVEQGQSYVVEHLQKFGLPSAQQKLAEYYLRDFSDISLYSCTEGSERVGLHHLFVPMTWSSYTDRWFTEEEEIENYSVMFEKITESQDKESGVFPNSRLVIEGEAGTGKTTFIKRLCYLWALHHTQKQTPEDFCQQLGNYSIVIPVILRLTQKNQQLPDILSDLCDSLTKPETLAIMKLMKDSPDKVLILMDGYDEFTSGCPSINKILSKEDVPATLCFTTTRPYAVQQLQALSSQAIHLLIKLLGFNNEQKLKYFTMFLHYYGKGEYAGKELFDFLENEREDLFEMAATPIRCEMIAIVWNAYGNLGKTVADLYSMFIIHLLSHFEKKEQHNLESEKQYLKKYSHILQKLGSLANTRQKSGHLTIVFTTQHIEEVLSKEGLKMVAKIGLLTKSHPSSHLDRVLWSFPHLSIQEFLTAYYLAHAGDADIESFILQCQKMKTLQRSEVIMQFLVSKYPTTANKILDKIIRSVKTENECEQLLEFLFKLCPYFDKGVHIPLPRFMDTNWCKYKEDMAKKLIHMDKAIGLQNLTSLRINTKHEINEILMLHYIQILEIEGEVSGTDISNIKHMKSVTKLTINYHYGGCSVNKLLQHVHAEKIQVLSLPALDDETLTILEKYPNLQELSIEKKKGLCLNKETFSKYRKLNKLTITAPCDPDLFTIQTPDLRLQLWGVNKKVLSQAVDMIKLAGTNCKVTHLVFYKNNMTNCGEELGEMMNYMSTLRVLDLSWCKITKETLRDMVNKMSGRQYLLSQVNLGLGNILYGVDTANNLSGSGLHLGKMISRMPHLHTLNLDRCELLSSDLVAMADAISASNNIYTLDLQGNNMGDAGGGECRLLQKMPSLQALRMGGYGHGDPVLGLCGAVREGALTKLQILDLSYSKVQPGSLKMLGQHLPRMIQLQVIDLKHITGPNEDENKVLSEEYRFVCENLPILVRHLDVYNTSITDDMILENKQHLSHLQKLHVKLDDTALDVVQEVMEEVRPDIQIYNDDYENVWSMYVTGKDNN